MVGISRVCRLVKLLVVMWLVVMSLFRVFFSLVCSRWVLVISLLKNSVFLLCRVLVMVCVWEDSVGGLVVLCLVMVV